MSKASSVHKGGIHAVKKSTVGKKAGAYTKGGALKRGGSDKKAVHKKTAVYKMTWTLPDGVRILAPKTAPKHFTLSQIRSAAKRG